MIGGPRARTGSAASFGDGKGEPGAVELGEPRLSAGALPQRQHRQHREGRRDAADRLYSTRRRRIPVARAGARRSPTACSRSPRPTRRASTSRAAGAATRASPAARSRRAAARTDTSVTVTSHDRQASRVGVDERARRREPQAHGRSRRAAREAVPRRSGARCRSSGRRRTRRSTATSTRPPTSTPETRAAAAKRVDRCAREAAGSAAGDAVRRRIPRRRTPARERVATSRGLFAYHRDDRRRSLGHRAHAGRHRLRVGERGRARLGR